VKHDDDIREPFSPACYLHELATAEVVPAPKPQPQPQPELPVEGTPADAEPGADHP
jgi:hypothetical protein